jgi:hypothetical protein
MKSWHNRSCRVLQNHQYWEYKQEGKSEGIFTGMDIEKVYIISCSFKRRAITRAQEKEIEQSDVEFMGQGRAVEWTSG